MARQRSRNPVSQAHASAHAGEAHDRGDARIPGGASSSQGIPGLRQELKQGDIPPSTPPVPVEPASSVYDFRNCKTRLDHNGPYYMPDVVAAIRVTHGNFLEMSTLLGRRRNAIRDFVYANIEAKDALDEEREMFIDQAEQAIRDQVTMFRDPGSIKFVLSTIGRDRGYAPKVEHTGAGGAPLSFSVELATGTDEAVQALTDKQRLEKALDRFLEEGIPLTERPS